MLSVVVRKLSPSSLGMKAFFDLMIEFIWLIFCWIGGGRSLLQLIRGMYITAFGNLSLAVLKKEPMESLSRLGLDVSLSFNPKDRMIFLMLDSTGVLCFNIWVACVNLAPGKQSVWILLSMMCGSLLMLESPIIIMGLLASNDQFSSLFPWCAW